MAKEASRMGVHPGESGFSPGERAGELTRLNFFFFFIQLKRFKSLRRRMVLTAIQCKISLSKIIITWFSHAFQSAQ